MPEPITADQLTERIEDATLSDGLIVQYMSRRQWDHIIAAVRAWEAAQPKWEDGPTSSYLYSQPYRGHLGTAYRNINTPGWGWHTTHGINAYGTADDRDSAKAAVEKAVRNV